MKLWFILLLNRMLGRHGQNAYVSKRQVIKLICRYQWVHRDRHLFVRELEQLKEDVNNETLSP